MKIKKTLLTVLLLGSAVCASAFAMSGCTDGGDDGTTEIPGEQTPLAPATCEHKNATHKNASPATCTENGNSEYWYCGDCKEYFSDAEYKNKTSLAAVTVTAGHNYGELIGETPATCTENGVKAHYHCNACNGNFDTEKNALTSLVIEAGHRYGELIPEVSATTCTNGVKAHYHCTGCNIDFDESKQEFLPPFGDINIYATHNLTLVPEKEATCEEIGVLTAYRHCNECGKNFDKIGLFETDPVTVEKLGHAYPAEFTYDYTEKLYKKVCANDNEHVITQEAGVEGYPYLANDIETLCDLLRNSGGHIILESDVSYNDYIVVNSENPTVLDLNGHTVTGTAWATFWVGTTNAPVITVKNGNISVGDKAFYTAVESNITLENVNITKSKFGIYASCGTFTVIGGEINADLNAMQIYSAKYYADPNSKPVNREDYDVTVNISDAKITGADIGLNLRSVYATVKNTVINTKNTCVIVYRDCNLTMTECDLTSQTNSGVQGNGTKLITDTNSGNYYSSGVNTVIKLNNCTIKAMVGIYHPQIDGKLTVNGGAVTGTKSAVEVRAGEVELNNVILTSTSTEFSAEANKSGSTTQGVALAVSQHTTDDNIIVTVTSSTLNGIYSVFEKDLMDDNQPKDIIINISDAQNTLNGLIYSENCDNIVNTADAEGNAIA